MQDTDRPAEPVKQQNRPQWRGREVSRLEAFSDSVFGFSVTLLVISLEVPRTFDQLRQSMYNVPSFACTFFLLFQVWQAQNLFFRRYGLQDTKTTLLNAVLLFLVIVYVYPLKFLFDLLFNQAVYVENGVPKQMISLEQWPEMLTLFGIGFTTVYLLLALLYNHARRNADLLTLTADERFETRTKIYSNALNVAIGIVLTISVWFVFPHKGYWNAYAYFLVFPAQVIYRRMRNARKPLVFSEQNTEPQAASD